MDGLARKLGFALRQLRQTPGFTLSAILTLALGIGATTAIFSLVEGVLLRPLPFRDADRLVVLGDHLGGRQGMSVTAREITTYANATEAFTSMGGYIGANYELSGGAQPEDVKASRLTAEVFPTLGVAPLIGRVFTAQEENAREPLAVISYSLWLNRYDRDRQILGKSIVLDRKTYSVIGVMPRDFEFPLQTGHLDQVQVWVPLSLTADELSDQHAGFWGYQIVARLKEKVSPEQAAKDADRVAGQIMRSFPASMHALHIEGDVELLRERVVADARGLLRALFMAVVVVLLIACVNVSGLLLVRAIRRQREYAIRLALGAPYGAILGEAALEGVLLSLSGGVLGLLLANAAIRSTLHLLPDSMPRVDGISLNATVVAFGLIVAVAAGVLCSLAPAFAALRTNLIEGLKDGDRNSTGGSSHGRLRTVLVVSQVAVALVLLTVAGAFLRSFQKMRAVDPGFQPDHVLVASYQLPLREYPTNDAVNIFQREAVDRLLSKPGIVTAGIINALPASDVSPQAAYTVEGVPAESWKLQFAAFAMTYGEYFHAMGIALVDGRTFSKEDRGNAPLVVVVNQTMARHCWPGQRAIGKRMHVGNPQKGLPWATVVGVVADTKIGSRDTPSADQWYLPAQQPAILFGTDFSGNLTNPAGGYITVRSALPPELMRETLRSTIAEIDPLLALEQVQPMSEVLSNVEAPRRFNTDLITGFAFGGLALAITGIYAVVAFSVSLRTQEIAIRRALGAQRTNIARLVLLSGAKLALVGCALGVLGSLAVSRLVSAFLFEVSATDPIIYIVCVLLMVMLALLASALPAMRAASADPIEALRSI